MFTLLDQTALDVSRRCGWSRREGEPESGSYHYSSLNFTPASCVSERTDHKIILLVYDVRNGLETNAFLILADNQSGASGHLGHLCVSSPDSQIT